MFSGYLVDGGPNNDQDQSAAGSLRAIDRQHLAESDLRLQGRTNPSLSKSRRTPTPALPGKLLEGPRAHSSSFRGGGKVKPMLWASWSRSNPGKETLFNNASRKALKSLVCSAE